MNIDRCYLLLGQFNRAYQSGDGSDYYQIDLREIMKGLYDKYNRFNLKLESYASRTSNSGTLPYESQFLQIAGFNWLSGYDTNSRFSNSRCAGVMYFEHLGGIAPEYLLGIVYPSDAGTLTFSRPASSKMTMELFATTPEIETKVNPLFGNESGNMLFSFTGVPDAFPIYRPMTIVEKTGQLVLNMAKAVALQNQNLALRWKVDLSQLIDRKTYNKYSKFALVTKEIQNNFTAISFSGFASITFMMSGLDWFSPSLKLNSTYTGSTSWLNYHQGAPTALSIISTSSSDIIKETFIDNVFYKPSSPNVELTITFNRPYTMDLTGVSSPVQPYYFVFNIVPVE